MPVERLPVMAFTAPEYQPPGMFLEPPAKRMRLMGAEPTAKSRRYAADDDDDDNDDEFDELLYEPQEVEERRDPDYKLTKKRIAANNRFQSAMADIIERFDHDFGDTGDEISFATGEVVVDRGHLSSLQIWGRLDEEEGAEGEGGDDDEDEGIRLEDLPDDWGEEDVPFRHPESSATPTSHQDQEIVAERDATPHAAEYAPQEPTSVQEVSASRRFEVVFPRKTPPLGFGWSDSEGQPIKYLSANPEEYDSGFGSSSSERRRSGRIRKQTDFLGKITWAEALGLESASTLVATEPHPGPSRHNTSAPTDYDYTPREPGEDGLEDSGVESPSPSPSSPCPVATIPDSQSTTVSSSSLLQNRSLPAVIRDLEVADSDAESDAESDTYLGSSHESTSLRLPDLQDEGSRQNVRTPGPVLTDDRAPSVTADDDPGDELPQNFMNEEESTFEDHHQNIEKAPISQQRPSEIPDSQEPISSAIQEFPGSHAAMRITIAQEPKTLIAHLEQEDDAQSCIAVDDTTDGFEEWAAASPAPSTSTPSRSKTQQLVQQITPKPSPAARKLLTPSKPRSSPANPRTPRHSIVNPSKPPSSRRSILSLVSDEKRDAGRRSDDEDELLREDELAVTIPQLFALSRSKKRRKKVKTDLFRTPVKQKRTDPPMTPLSNGKTCGQGGGKCGSSFCFTCM